MPDKRSPKKIFLVLDIGTSTIKCGCIEPDSRILAQHHRRFPMKPDQNLFESDFDQVFETTSDLLKACLAEDGVRRSGVDALLITSQAQTFAPVDAGFQPLRPGIVWLDERAGEEAEILERHVPDFAAAAGFARPLPALYASKLLWLKRNEPDIFQKARAFPLIHEYLAYHLTGHFYSDSTNFGMGGVFDFRRKDLNPEILAILGLTPKAFPKIERAATRGERISNKIQQKWGWPARFPVFLCGNDQGASACGAGLRQPGDVALTFGTALVLYTVTQSLVTNLNDNQIAGKHPIGKDYFLLTFESDFGVQLRRLKEQFFSRKGYDALFHTFWEYPNAEPRRLPADSRNWSDLSAEEGARLSAGVIRYYLTRLQNHLNRIQGTGAINNLFLSGGMTESPVWLDILRDVLSRPLAVHNRTDSGLFGAVTIYLNNQKKTA